MLDIFQIMEKDLNLSYKNKKINITELIFVYNHNKSLLIYGYSSSKFEKNYNNFYKILLFKEIPSNQILKITLLHLVILLSPIHSDVPLTLLKEDYVHH